jgi:CheY-like chemotaxis protein
MGNGKAVIVAGQDLFFAVRLNDALHAMGYRGLTVQDQSELLAALGKERSCLIILDLQAEGLRPHDVVSAARALPGRLIPILAYGPHADIKKRAEALEAGCRRVVPKSMIAAELPMLVKSILRT